MMYLKAPFDDSSKLKIINGHVTYPPKPSYSPPLLALLSAKHFFLPSFTLSWFSRIGIWEFLEIIFLYYYRIHVHGGAE